MLKHFFSFLQTIAKRTVGQAAPRTDRDLFVPHFANGRKTFESFAEKRFDNDESTFSQESVISSWDNLSTGHHEEEVKNIL